MNRNGMNFSGKESSIGNHNLHFGSSRQANICRRVIITINEPEFHSFTGQDQRRSTMRFREVALWQMIGRRQRGEV
jgi:hypothetical protein